MTEYNLPPLDIKLSDKKYKTIGDVALAVLPDKILRIWCDDEAKHTNDLRKKMNKAHLGIVTSQEIWEELKGNK